MGLKSDAWIRRMAADHRMIEPFAGEQVRDGVVSYGLSSYGYDMRVAGRFQVFAARDEGIVDPKAMDPGCFRPVEGECCIIPPNSFVLARTVEYFRIPPGVLALTFGKSTYARCGVIVNVTPLEPGWEGYITMGISNTAPRPAKVHAGEGIAQVLFFEGDEPCLTTYADRKGKYQAQADITLPKL